MTTPSLFSRLLREPLLHFVLIGALVFGIDHFTSGRKDNPNLILLGPDVDRELRVTYYAARGTEPGANEMKALRQRWIDNEVLYREGLALRVDQGDAAIRERVILKALSLVEAGLALPGIDEAGLRDWFEKNRAKYDQRARLDFLEAVLANDAGDEPVQAFVNALNGAGRSAAKSGLRIFKDRPRANVAESFGAEFTAALEALPAQTWAAVPSKDGLRVVRLQSSSPGKVARFEEAQAAVLQDWKDATLQQLRTTAVRDIGGKYSVKTVAE